MVFHFCPLCSNLLLLDNTGELQFCCTTCSYVERIVSKIRHQVTLERKQVDDVLGGAKALENADKTAAKCTSPKCENEQAYFIQMQIRSADEPMTTFYTCTKCMHKWREN